VQNAVKYNIKNGTITIDLSLLKQEENDQIKFVTRIIDSGNGIGVERIEYLFELFGELKSKKEQHKVKDLGIGVGLSNSKELCSALGGSVRLVST
jgi:signal transduction histidine kinase